MVHYYLVNCDALGPLKFQIMYLMVSAHIAPFPPLPTSELCYYSTTQPPPSARRNSNHPPPPLPLPLTCCLNNLQYSDLPAELMCNSIVSGHPPTLPIVMQPAAEWSACSHAVVVCEHARSARVGYKGGPDLQPPVAAQQDRYWTLQAFQQGEGPY